jgi:hypothetical protein
VINCKSKNKAKDRKSLASKGLNDNSCLNYSNKYGVSISEITAIYAVFASIKRI